MEVKAVLLVEDNSTDEELTVRALKKSGIAMDISVARDGEEALAHLLPNEPRPLPDLVLLDLKLPKVSGLDVLERLRANKHTQNLPVIVVSSSTKPEDVAAAYRLGCNGYMAKGVDYVQFVESAKTLAQYWLLYNVPPVREAGTA
jgi:two-component system response regulator